MARACLDWKGRELKNVAGVERVRNKPREHTIPVEYIEDVQMTFGCHINPFLPNAHWYWCTVKNEDAQFTSNLKEDLDLFMAY